MVGFLGGAVLVAGRVWSEHCRVVVSAEAPSGFCEECKLFDVGFSLCSEKRKTWKQRKEVCGKAHYRQIGALGTFRAW